MKIPLIDSRNVLNDNNTACVEKSTSADFSNNIYRVNEKTEVELNLEYYHSLCKEFSGITFRLEDIQTALKLNDTGKEYMGYNGSMNQVGSNFGAIGQCSIEIDVAVIEKMRTDPKYEQSVKWHIQFSKERFAEYQIEIPEQPFTFVCIEDNNGKVQTSRGHSSVQPATEEEIKGKMRVCNGKAAQIDSSKMAGNLIDSYLSMIEESERKRKEFIRHHKSVNDAQSSMMNGAKIMSQVSGEYSQSFVYKYNWIDHEAKNENS